MGYNHALTLGVPNGSVHLTVILASALRLFAGGSKYDISSMYGISLTFVEYSMNWVLDAVNVCETMAIRFQGENFNVQQEIAKGFQQKSKAGFSICCGTLDGMLVWLQKPTDDEYQKVGVDSQKVHCVPKNNFGLNLQAICDSNQKFLHIYMGSPGSTSDFLAWECSALRKDFENEGFLAPGLCLFGDNAYTNSPFMATPYPNATGTKDDYNFYHSQLRIHIECDLGC